MGDTKRSHDCEPTLTVLEPRVLGTTSTAKVSISNENHFTGLKAGLCISLRMIWAHHPKPKKSSDDGPKWTANYWDNGKTKTRLV